MKRIIHTKKESSELIEIYPIQQPPKNLMMQVWLALWSMCGALVLYQLTIATESNTKVICIIYMGFWSYFEFLIFRIYRWRKSGKEEIEIFKDKITISRLVSNRGLPVHYEINEISKMSINVNKKQGMFSKLLFDDYWTIGTEAIVFQYKHKQYGFGMQLDEAEAAHLYRLMKHSEMKK